MANFVGEMIQSNKRLVVFAENKGEDKVDFGYHKAWDYIWDTQHSVIGNQSSFMCETRSRDN